MFKKWYAIKGITNELFDAWKNDLRSDILWWKEPEEETQLRIRLPLIEAIKMRILIRQFNKKNLLSLQLVRMQFKQAGYHSLLFFRVKNIMYNEKLETYL